LFALVLFSKQFAANEDLARWLGHAAAPPPLQTLRVSDPEAFCGHRPLKFEGFVSGKSQTLPRISMAEP
jgi:hypothetical protein